MKKQINIGWGRSSIKPDRPVAITGQFYVRISQGEYQPVTANALVIENGDDAVIFVSTDIVGIRNYLLDRVQNHVREMAPDLPVEKIIMNATHTHAGPSPSKEGAYPSSVDFLRGDDAAEFIAGRVAEAVVQAWKTRAPGKIAFGYGFATVGHSRRVIYLDDIGQRLDNAAERAGFSVNGHGKMYGNTDDPMFSHYEAGTDSFINLLYTFDMNDKLTGAIVNVPCPGQTGEHTWVLHPGFWHNVREKIRARHGDIGIIAQCAAAGDLSPRQLHYKKAELRRYQLKYPELYAKLVANPLPCPEAFFKDEKEKASRNEGNMLDMLRAEDIGERVAAAFDEVLSWAQKDKVADPELHHEFKTVGLERRMYPEVVYKEELENYKKFMAEDWQKEGDEPWSALRANSTLNARRGRCKRVIDTYEHQENDKTLSTGIHAVRIGDAAFVSNRFELFMDYMHRIQARSPFVQTFIVQLTADNGMTGGSYLATERAVANKGYSASPYCNQVSPTGGQQLVEDTVEMLKKLHE